MLRVLALLTMVLGVLGGCSTGAPNPQFHVPTGRYEQAFDAAREVLRDYRFQLERVDASQGVITTQPKGTAGLASPWDSEQSTLGREVEDLLNLQRRVVRVTFEDAAGGAEGVTGDGPVTGRVEVTVYRMQTPNLKPSSRAIAMTSVTVNPQATAQGTGFAYETPVSQDSRLAARLAQEIGQRAAGLR